MKVATVLLIVLLNMSAFRASKVIVSLFAIELGASQFIIGVMIALYSFFPALLAVHAGKLSDRLGMRLPMLCGSLGMVLALVLPGLFPSMAALYASAMLIGVTHMFYNVAAQRTAHAASATTPWPWRWGRSLVRWARVFPSTTSVTPAAISLWRHCLFSRC
jgi:MFS family permease